MKYENTVVLMIRVGITGPVTRFLFSTWLTRLCRTRKLISYFPPIPWEKRQPGIPASRSLITINTSNFVPTSYLVIYYSINISIPTPSTAADFHNPISRSCLSEKESPNGTHGAASEFFFFFQMSRSLHSLHLYTFFCQERTLGSRQCGQRKECEGAFGEGNMSGSLRQKRARGSVEEISRTATIRELISMAQGRCMSQPTASKRRG